MLPKRYFRSLMINWHADWQRPPRRVTLIVVTVVKPEQLLTIIDASLSMKLTDCLQLLCLVIANMGIHGVTVI